MQSLRNHIFYICELGCCFITFDKVCLNTVWTHSQKEHFFRNSLSFIYSCLHFCYSICELIFWGNSEALWKIQYFSLGRLKVMFWILQTTKYRSFLKTENIFCCWQRQMISVLSQGLCQYDFPQSHYCVSEFDYHHTLNVIQSESVF